MFQQAREHYRSTLKEIEEAGLYKSERIVRSPQGARIAVAAGEVLNFCANNYLGLSSAPEILEAAHQGLDARGFGLSSVRFICGTQDIHKELEGKISRFLGTEDTILYGSCFDANGGLFETLLSEEDAVVSDALNHASIIDGIRLSKAKRFRYQNRDLEDLERQLQEASSCALQAHRDRRCLQHGRDVRAARWNLRACGALPGDGDGGRLPRDGFRGEERPGHSRALRGSGRGWTSSPRPWERLSAGRRAASLPAARRSSIY